MRPPAVNPPEEPQSMSAMTDVVFLLLIFFIVTMSGYVEMTLLETNLPVSGAETAGEADLQNTLKIEITVSGEYVINGIPQTAASLNRLLRRYARLMPEAEFLIACAPESRHHTLVSLLAVLSRHQLKNIKLIKNSRRIQVS